MFSLYSVVGNYICSITESIKSFFYSDHGNSPITLMNSFNPISPLFLQYQCYSISSFFSGVYISVPITPKSPFPGSLILHIFKTSTTYISFFSIFTFYSFPLTLKVHIFHSSVIFFLIPLEILPSGDPVFQLRIFSHSSSKVS